MNKKLLSLAVAAVVTAPTAAMAEAVLYGRLHVSIDYADVTNAGTSAINADGNPYDVHYVDPDGNWTGSNDVRYVDEAGNPLITGGEDFTGWGVASEGSEIPGSGRASRLGVKGSEDLGNGLKAIYQIELGLNLGDDDITSGSNGISYRNTFAGIAGDFGTFLVGRHDTPLKISTGKLDMFSDTMADYNGTVGFDDLRVDNAIAYISPSFAGFSFAGALVAPGGGTDGFGDNINSDQLNGAYSLAIIYKNGPFHGSAAYESISNEMFMDSQTSLLGKEQCINTDGTPTLSCSYVDNDYSKWRLGLGLLDWNGFTLTAIYEQQDDLPGGQMRSGVTVINPDGTMDMLSESDAKEQRLWQIQAGYSFGNNMVKAMYGAVDRDGERVLDATRRNPRSISNIKDDLGGDREAWAIGFDHNFSKRTKVYALYTDVSDDLSDVPGNSGLEWSGFSLGLLHKF